MKARKNKTLVLTVVLVVIVGLAAAFTQSKPNLATKQSMREKLKLSRLVLEGLAPEEYDLINELSPHWGDNYLPNLAEVSMRNRFVGPRRT